MQSYGTAYFALVRGPSCRPGSGCSCSAPAVASGLGAVDVGHALGLQVIAAASSPEKRELADEPGRGRDHRLEHRGRQGAGPEISGGGVDAVYDPIGGVVGEECLRALGDDGQFLVIGFASGDDPAAAGQPGPAAQPAGHRCRVGRLGAQEPGREPAMVEEIAGHDRRRND